MKISQPSVDLSVGEFKDRYLEREPLPIGRTQFEEFEKRIVSLARVDAHPDSLRFCLLERIISLGPCEAYKEDAYFVLALRKIAANETAVNLMQELKEKQAKAMASTKQDANGKVLELQDVYKT